MGNENSSLTPVVDVTGRFVLGHGAEGTAGYVKLRVSLAKPGVKQVKLAALDAPSSALNRVESELTRRVSGYIAGHPELGLHVLVTAVLLDPVRRNDLERACALAFLDAVNELRLPPIPIFAAPADDSEE